MASKEKSTIKRIAQWNRRGAKSALKMIMEYCYRHQINAFLLNETKLTPDDRISIPPYRIYRTDRSLNRGGGSAILVHPTLHPIRMGGYLPHRNAEEVVVKIKIGRKHLLLITWYSATPDYTSNSLKTFLSQFDLPKIIMGDFNAHSRAWGSDRTCQWGHQIDKLLADAEYRLMNDGRATYVRAPAYESCLDLTK